MEKVINKPIEKVKEDEGKKQDQTTPGWSNTLPGSPAATPLVKKD